MDIQSEVTSIKKKFAQVEKERDALRKLLRAIVWEACRSDDQDKPAYLEVSRELIAKADRFLNRTTT